MRKLNLFFILISWFSFSQNKQVLYGFSEIPQALLSNPGSKVSNIGYLGLPFASHFHLSLGTSGTTAYDLFAVDGINFNTKIERAINNSTEKDFFTINQQLELFSGGFSLTKNYGKKQYISFGVYQEFDFISYFPKDFAVLAFEGNQANIGVPFQANQISISAEVISVWHLGYNKKVNNKLTYGLRGKIYSSIINVNSINNEGAFTTLSSNNNFYRHIFNLDIAVKTSGYASNGDELRFEPRDVSKRLFFGGNLGLGFDAGFTYNFTDRLMFDGSIQDIGFIRHTKEVENYKVKGNFEFEGIDPIFFDQNDGDTANDFFNNIETQFEDLFDIEDNRDSYTTWRPVKFNVSLNYSFGKMKDKDCNCLTDETPYINRAGVQLYAIKRPKGLQMALTGYYYRRLFKSLRAKVTYTLDSYSFNNIGFGLSAHVGGANFYILADNFLQYQNIYDAQSVSLQLGINYIFNKNEK